MAWGCRGAGRIIGVCLLAVGDERRAAAALGRRVPVMPPPNAIFINVDGEGFSVSPDGRMMVFTAQTLNGSSSLWLRPVHSMTARPLPGTQGAIFTFWSPDSRSVAFCARDGILRRMDVGSGAPLPLAELGFYNTAVPASGSWSVTGVILIGSATGLRRVSAAGGGVDTVTTVDPTRKEIGHTYPQFLPDGNLSSTSC